jgi:hypothetical protein
MKAFKRWNSQALTALALEQPVVNHLVSCLAKSRKLGLFIPCFPGNKALEALIDYVSGLLLFTARKVADTIFEECIDTESVS